MLVADIGGGTSDFSLVRVGPGAGAAGRAQGRHPRQPRRPHRRHRLRPPGRARERPAAVRLRRVRAEHRRRAAARGAERGLLRPRDLAPDQHRLQPAARRRAARHALVLRRPGAAPAPDDASSTQRLGHDLRGARRGREDRRRRRRRDDDRPRPRRGGAGERARRGRGVRARSTPTSTASSPRRATTVAQAGLAPGAVDALYLTGGSTGLDLLSERLRRAFSGARGRCAATASPASRPAWRCFAQRRFGRRRAGVRRPTPPSRQSASTAAIARAGRLDVAAVQPGDAHAAPSARR